MTYCRGVDRYRGSAKMFMYKAGETISKKYFAYRGGFFSS